MTITEASRNAAGQRAGRGRPDCASAVVAALLVPTVSLALAVVDPRLRHWFLIPVTLCGVLVAVDVVDWLRRRRDAMDPQALVALVGLHFFYAAPILHVLLDYWMREAYPDADWPDALGVMAVLNAAGLGIYRVVLALRSRERPAARPARFDPRVFHVAALAAVALGLAAFAAEVAAFGGLRGLFGTLAGNRGALAGWGWVLIVAESFPLVAFALAALRWRAVLARRPVLVLLLLTGFTVAQFLVSGVRGSRNNTVWPVLVALLLVHYLIRRVPRRALLGFAAVFVAFMYGYGLYKGAGVQVIDIARGERSVAEVADRTGRDLPTVLLGDLGRADVQALVLDRARSGRASPAEGSTYLSAPSFMAPHWLFPEPPPGKVAVGTDALYGTGAYEAGIRSSRVYGVTGEAVLNFGWLGGLFSFAVFGLAVRAARRYCERTRQTPSPARRLLAPSITVLAVSALSWDADNLVWFVLKHALPLAAVVAVTVLVTARRRETATVGGTRREKVA